MDLRDYFLYLLKLLMDISKGILTIRPLGFQSLFPSLPSSFKWKNMDNKSSMDLLVYFLRLQ
jgi:hypothetical protein